MKGKLIHITPRASYSNDSCGMGSSRSYTNDSCGMGSSSPSRYSTDSCGSGGSSYSRSVC